ncbi:ACT domain-containing protein [Janibacter melonis]|uniref:ACT domain-containing protein n=1 Tax=Janibacter melonis TaxID=262209 RepID=UPI002094297E|nr:ACT domain-containing protein [Janibacter melonis]
MTDLVLTVTADDRAGLVSRLAQVVADRGGSWTTSSMAHLAGTFAGVVLVSVPADGVTPSLRTRGSGRRRHHGRRPRDPAAAGYGG